MKALIPMAALAATLAPAPGEARTPVAVGAFDSVELQGGGHVIVRHGRTPSVTLIRGDLETTRFTVDHDGRLAIDACVRSCPGYRLEVEIVTPELDGLAIQGGGEIRTEGAFPSRSRLALAISGGGEIDATAIESGSVAAAIDGGGSILAHARDSLMAAIDGGGEIRYRGDPSVTSAIDGGGSVRPMSSR